METSFLNKQNEMDQELILVDEQDNVVGYGNKLTVHEEGKLHRAFSIFVVNDQDQLLLQQRAFHKYHSGGLWANTCCSHPIKGEPFQVTLKRRLNEEMGFECDLEPLFSFIYRAEFENGLIEHEFDHVFLGRYQGDPDPNQDEVAHWKWIDLDQLRHDLIQNPSNYVFWLRTAFEQFCDHFEKQK